MKKFYGMIAIALVLGLAACSEESSEQKASEPPATTEDSASQTAPATTPAPKTEVPAAQSQSAPAQAEAPAAPAANPQPKEKPAAEAEAAPGTPSKDEQACLQAVSTQTNNGEVVTLSVEPSEANTIVMVGVGPNKAPWKCLSKGGVVAEVMSMTDEGGL
jgi:uncharacterized lipoprotein